jgi:hypothetical protein
MPICLAVDGTSVIPPSFRLFLKAKLIGQRIIIGIGAVTNTPKPGASKLRDESMSAAKDSLKLKEHVITSSWICRCCGDYTESIHAKIHGLPVDEG